MTSALLESPVTPERVAAVLNGIAPLPHLGLIKVEGADAATFLQGQLTQDFVLLKADEARLAAFCSAKGRMQASFIGFKRSDSEILLICSRDILAATLKRLSMFVMRAKAKLTDATDEFQLLGLAGGAITNVANYQAKTGAIAVFDGGNLISQPSALGIRRALWVAPVGTSAPQAEPLDADVWRWGEVLAGIATITQLIVDAFVPQMLNYESVGGVNFKKGCYPGQEVVARSQFRGTLKRRAYRVYSAVDLAAGDEVFSSADPEQPCGTIAQAAPSPLGGFDAIASMQVAAAAAACDGTVVLAAGSATDGKLALRDLPYALLDDI